MIWWWLIELIVVAIVAVAMTPKTESQPPAGLDQFTIPTAKVGREIPVLFGTKLIRSSNVVWYGDLKTEPIRS